MLTGAMIISLGEFGLLFLLPLVLGAVALNVVLAVNHRPGRYVAF